MFLINKDNIIDYIKTHFDEFDDSGSIQVKIMGEDPTADEGEGDGHINVVYKIITPTRSYVLKQGVSDPRNLHSGASVASYRNDVECETMRILHAIVPEYVPEIIFQDKENHIFMMDYIDNLRAVRFQLIKDNQLADLGTEVGNFLARSAFYTSEYYLDRATFRSMQTNFECTDLRAIMEDGIFLDRFGTDQDPDLANKWERFSAISNDPACQTNRLALRRRFMTHSDCLIHSDFHTSNVFLSDDGYKMLDFEFSFMGPFGYDLGYFAGSLFATYCASCFKEYPSEKERQECKAYLLSTLKMLYESYNKTFRECWEKDAKPEYKNQKAFLDIILKETLQDSAGYAAITNWCRTSGIHCLPEYNLHYIDARRLSMAMAVLMDHQMILLRDRFNTVDDLIDMIIHFEKTFFPLI